MGDTSRIEWTDATWNPVTGCNKVSAGCKNCYAEKMAERLQKIGAQRYRNGFQVTLHPDALEQPLKWTKPRRIFVNSMSDLFHEDVPDEFIEQVFDVMAKAKQHTFQILTKRDERLRDLSPWINWPDNVWIGVSVENEAVKRRINALEKCQAKVKFISFEPLIGEVYPSLFDINWVIVGGESGPGARPMKLDWVLTLQRACASHCVPFFFKQWGHISNNPDQNDPTAVKGDPNYAKGGCQLEGKIVREMPGFA